MQPLPRDMASNVFATAASSFTSAIPKLGSPEAAPLLAQGASSMRQGITSLKWNTNRNETSDLAAALNEASSAAAALAKDVAAGNSPAVSQETVAGWAQLAGAASFMLTDRF